MNSMVCELYLNKEEIKVEIQSHGDMLREHRDRCTLLTKVWVFSWTMGLRVLILLLNMYNTRRPWKGHWGKETHPVGPGQSQLGTYINASVFMS